MIQAKEKRFQWRKSRCLTSDLISRQAAIDDAHKQIWYRMNQQGMRDRVDEWLKALPSAQPERKRGKWIVHYECPKCGEITKDFTEFCPFCNADMRGEKDE